MKNLRRAERKKLIRKIKPGDVVTWGDGIWAHRVVSVSLRGVVVDATSQGFPRYAIAFDSNARSGEGGRGPVWIVDAPADTKLVTP